MSFFNLLGTKKVIKEEAVTTKQYYTPEEIEDIACKGFKETKGILIPSSEEDVRMLNKVLEIVTQNQFIMEKDILELCEGDISLCNKTKYCLIDTEAIIPATNWNGRYNKHPENTARYLDTGYYKALYEKHKKYLIFNKSYHLWEILRNLHYQTQMMRWRFLIVVLSSLFKKVSYWIKIYTL